MSIWDLSYCFKSIATDIYESQCSKCQVSHESID